VPVPLPPLPPSVRIPDEPAPRPADRPADRPAGHRPLTWWDLLAALVYTACALTLPAAIGMSLIARS
jgi:hypothetical protein